MSSSGGKGAGLGLKLLLGAGALAYGIKEATYTGKPTSVSLFAPNSQYVGQIALTIYTNYKEIRITIKCH